MHTAITSLWIVWSLLPFLVLLSLPPTVLWIPQSITGPIALMIFSGRAESASCCPESNKLQPSSFRLSLAFLILRGPLLLTGWAASLASGAALASRSSKALKLWTAHSREPVPWMGLCKAGWAHKCRDLDKVYSWFYNFSVSFALHHYRVYRSKGTGHAAFFHLPQLRQSQRRSGSQGELWRWWLDSVILNDFFQTEQFYHLMIKSPWWNRVFVCQGTDLCYGVDTVYAASSVASSAALDSSSDLL